MEKPKRKYYRRSEDYVPKFYNPTDLAYMAGIIDGEGCFFMAIVKKRAGDGYVNAHYRGLLQISNTAECIMDWLRSTFSGTASAICRSTSSRKFEREVFDWIATGDRLLDICEQILPYLIIKKSHCENMIKFRKTYTEQIGSHKVSEENLRIRQECYEISRKLNTRFHLHPMKQ